jgi:dihydropteroate synthase
VSDAAANTWARSWRIGPERVLPLEPFVLMGVLNVTPDSFSDGGAFARPEAAIEHALAMVAEGAGIIDVGGESTRPGAARVPAEEQIRRVGPVIAGLRQASPVPISIDTTLAAVARAALDAGADIVNDVSAGGDDADLLPLVASRGAGLVLMHRVLPPDRDRYSTAYAAPLVSGDVVRAVADWLLARVQTALDLGVEPDAIGLDPGLGFGKTVEQNYELLGRSGELADLGHPLVVGASRKSFIGRVTGVEDPAARVHGSVVAATIAWSGGARIVRTHDIAATRQGLLVAQATLAAEARRQTAQAE